MRENRGEMILIGLRFDDLPNQKKPRFERFLCEENVSRRSWRRGGENLRVLSGQGLISSRRQGRALHSYLQ